MNRIGMVAGVLVFTVVLTPVRGEDKLLETPYFPLKVGTTWTYKVVDVPGAKTVNKVIKHEKVGDVLCARLENFVDGKSIANEHLTVTKDGIYRVAFNGVSVTPPLLILKLPPKKGDSWKVEAKISTETLKGSITLGEESITVPAGKYDAAVTTADFEASGQKLTAVTHYAKGVGIVRLKMTTIRSFAVELEKFEAGK